MRFGRFFWKLFLGNAALMVLLLGTSVWLILEEFDDIRDEEITTFLRSQAAALEALLADEFEAGDVDRLRALTVELTSGKSERVRLTLIAPDGVVLADSDAPAERMDNHAGRPEVVESLQSGWSMQTRWSHTVSNELKYVAVRVGTVDDPVGVIRLAVASRSIDMRSKTARRLVWAIALVVLIAAGILALGLAAIWSRRISRITDTARQISAGDLSARVRVTGFDEVAELGRALNQMREHLTFQVETIDRQRRTLESLLGQLSEGVVVARPDGRVVLMNPEAARLLGVPSAITGDNVQQRATVEQCIPHHELQKMLLFDLAHDGEPTSTGAEFDTDVLQVRLGSAATEGATTVLARASDIVLPAVPGVAEPTDHQIAGRLLVLTDVSELTRTIQIKTDFVANASHELRTPLAAVRAAAETLLQLSPGEDPETARRFARVIDRHSARLEDLVADLLDLSRLEAGTGGFPLEDLAIPNLTEELDDRWSETAATKGVHWKSRIPDGAKEVRANAHLFQLIMDNLIDNAIKFTERGGQVEVGWSIADDDITVSVVDSGCGIVEEEQERVFERFYQTERARSGIGKPKEDRGTGLGLAIVRHAANAMGAQIRLESRAGKGTTVAVTFQKTASGVNKPES